MGCRAGVWCQVAVVMGCRRLVCLLVPARYGLSGLPVALLLAVLRCWGVALAAIMR